MPELAPAKVRELLAQQRLDADSAGPPLPYAVRAVGQALRDYGRVEAAAAPAQEELRILRSVTKKAAFESGGAALVRLRAIQAELFIAAVVGPASDERTRQLTELGGAFALDPRVLERPLPLLVPELAAVFRIRWGQLSGLASARAFRTTPVEELLAARLQLASPVSLFGTDSGRQQQGAAARAAELDHDYPLHLALGTLAHARHDYGAALGHYRRHLAESPDGPWTLRARNFAADAAAHIVLGE